MARIRLTQDFYLDEFLRSETAARMGRDVSADLTPEVQANLKRLCEIVLQPLRNVLDVPITVLSGFRPEWLNRAVGGSRSSDHLRGCAGDIVAVGVAPLHLAEIIRDKGLPFDQVVNEFGQWCHVSVMDHPGAAPLRRCLTIWHDRDRKLHRTTGLHRVAQLRQGVADDF